MNPILKNILAVIAGIIIGGIINWLIIMLSPSIIPLPDGVDPNDVASIKANIDSYGIEQFIFPFLAHAIGSLTGGFIAAKVAASNKMIMATIVGVFFFIGGISAVYMIGGPMWFVVLDLVVAYIPMAYLGYILATR